MQTATEKERMYTAILLDGTRNPICIQLDRKDKHDQQMNYPPASITWAPSATAPARYFNFVSEHFRKEGVPLIKEVRVYKSAGVDFDSPVLGLEIDGSGGGPVTVAEQAARMVDEFLNFEKYQFI